MTVPVINPYENFLNLAGTGINLGKLYIGVAGQDPETNPQAVYWDAAQTIPATQPLITIGGLIYRSGSPAQAYTPDTFSMRLRDRFNQQVFYKETVTSRTISDALAFSDAQKGQFRTAIDVYSKAEVDLRIPFLNLETYYTGGNIPYVDPGSAITYASRQAAPNVSDAMDAMLAAASAMQNSGVRQVVCQLPPGVMTLSRTHTIPNGVKVQGSGEGIASSATHLRRIGNYGNTFNMGLTGVSGVVDAAISDVCMYQDHGGDGVYGQVNPPAASFINKATTGAHIDATGPTSCTVERVKLYNLPFGLIVRGGIMSSFKRIDLNGIWDPTSVARQEGLQALTVTSVVDGANHFVPTWHEFEDVRCGGDVLSDVTLPCPDGLNIPNQYRNIGYRYGFVLECCEELYLRGMNVSACQKSSFLVRSKSGRILQGLHATGCTFSPCGTDIADAFLKFENEDVGGQAVRLNFTGCVWLGQGNGLRAISDYGSTATNGSVNGLTLVGCQISTFIMGPIWLENARHVNIEADILDWNTKNHPAYAGDKACGIYIGAGTVVVNVDGCLGGAVTGAVTGHFCMDGVRCDNAVTSRVTVKSADGGLLGALQVHNGVPVATRRPYEGTGVVPDVDSTHIFLSTSQNTYCLVPLTANRTVTLSPLDLNGRPVPDGAEAYYQRAATSTGAFTMSIGGLKNLATGTWCRVQVVGGAWRLKDYGAL